MDSAFGQKKKTSNRGNEIIICSEKLGVGHRECSFRTVQVHDEMDSPRLFVICGGERKRNTMSARERKEFYYVLCELWPQEQIAIDREERK